MHQSVRLPPGKASAAALLVCAATILLGSHSLQPLVWNDTTSFLSSAVHSAWSDIRAEDGVGAGYVLALKAVLDSGHSLRALIALQHIVWALSVTTLAYAVVRVCTRASAAALLVLLVAYPGLYLYHNLLLAESLYTSALTFTLAALLLAGASAHHRRTVFLALAILLAGAAALLKTQGAAPLAVTVALCAFLARDLRPRAWAALAAALLVAAAGMSLAQRARQGDTTALLFGAKTFFCIHSDLVLSDPALTPHATHALGERGPEFVRQLAHDVRSPPVTFPVLGFNAEACQFDSGLDAALLKASAGDAHQAAAWYRSAFVSAVTHDPTAYAAKVARQLAYGLVMAVPPHGISDIYTGVPERSARARMLVAGQDGGIDDSAVVPAAWPARLGTAAVFGARAVSLLAGIAILAALACFWMPRWRAIPAAQAAFGCSLLWLAQSGTIAVAHTLDVWRYIVPVVPCAIASLVFVVDAGCQTVAAREVRE